MDAGALLPHSALTCDGVRSALSTLACAYANVAAAHLEPFFREFPLKFRQTLVSSETVKTTASIILSSDPEPEGFWWLLW